MSEYNKYLLLQKQALPLDAKIAISERSIREFHERMDGRVYISFSGGKDSTVLLHLVRNLYPDTPAVFMDTGVEWPEVRDFVKTIENVTFVKPEKSFADVIKECGYPVVSKRVATQLRHLQNPSEKNTQVRRLALEGMTLDNRYLPKWKMPKKWYRLIDAPFKISEKCCYWLKKKPAKAYEKETKRKPYIGTMAFESDQRTRSYLVHGCNTFDPRREASRPLSVWTDEDVWEYIKRFDLPYCEIYDKGVKRTGCVFCLFGAHLDKHPNRFEQLKILNPGMYNYCMNKLDFKTVLDYLGIEVRE